MQERHTEGWIILMADGSLEDHNIVKKAARECGINHVFTSVYNGSQLMDYLQGKGAYFTETSTMPDLLLMDIKLDIVDGFEVLDFMRKYKHFKFPIYVLTATKREEDVVRAMHYGVKGFFQKPLSYGEWAKMVGAICKASFQAKKEKH